MHHPTGRWRLGLGLSLTAVLMWGMLPIAQKLLLASMDAFTITWYRFLFAAVLLGGWLRVRGGMAGFGGLRRGDLVLLAVCVTGLCANYILYMLGLNLITPSPAQLVIQMAPLMLMIGAMVLFGERFNRRQWLGSLVLVIGSALFFHDRFDELLAAGRYAQGVALILVAAMSWAIYALTQKRLLGKLPSALIMWTIYTSAVVLFLPGAKPGSLAALDPPALGLLLFCCLNTMIAYGSFAESLAHWEATRVSAVLAITPLVTIASMGLVQRYWPGLIAPERLDTISMAGAGLVVVGSAITALAGSAGVNNR